MARDPKTPVTFNLPDGDSVALIPWDYVIDKLNEFLTPVADSIESINSDLTRIDNKLSEWVDEDEETES